MAFRFRSFLLRLAPRWLVEGEGGDVLRSLGVVMDAEAERARLAVHVRFPEDTPDDALGPMGRDRKIVRGVSESREHYVSRLLPWLDDHRVRGNPYALMRQLRGYLGVDLLIRTVDIRGNWYWINADGSQGFDLDTDAWDWDDEPTTKWSRFWVIIYPPPELWTDGPTWGDPNLWDGAWGNDGFTWGTTATPAEVRDVRRIVNEWKPAGTRCINIIIAFDPDSFDPALPSPSGAPVDGLWYRASKNIGGVAVRSRLATARYWAGT